MLKEILFIHNNQIKNIAFFEYIVNCIYHSDIFYMNVLFYIYTHCYSYHIHFKSPFF